MMTLIKLDIPVDLTSRLHSVLHYTGDPIDAQSVVDGILLEEGYRVKKDGVSRRSGPRQAGVGGE